MVYFLFTIDSNQMAKYEDCVPQNVLNYLNTLGGKKILSSE